MQDKKDLMDATVFVSNPIIQAKRKMNILGERIFKLGLASLHPHIEGKDDIEYDTEFKEIIIPYKKLVEMFGNEFAPPDIKRAIRQKKNEAVAGYIERKTEDGWEDAVPLYSYIGYKDRVGLRFKFNEEWKKDLIQLAKNPGFSSYKLKEVFDLSSVHAMRLMELMQMKAGHFKDHDEVYYELSIDFLKKTLMKEEYNGRNDSFRRVVINPAVKEINEKTRYELKYINVKEGRKVTAYKFLMKIKKDYKEKVKETIDVSASDFGISDVPQMKELSTEKKKYADKLHQTGLEPYSLCEEFVKERSVGALRYVCDTWNKSQNFKSPLGGGWVRKMLSPDDESGEIPAEKEAARIAEKERKERERKDREYGEKQKNKTGLDLDKLPKETQESDFAKMLMKRKESETP